MTLADLLHKQFRADFRFRGDGYFKADKVELLQVTPDRVAALVQDGAGYRTELDRTGGELRKSCSCTQFDKFGACKHLWGTVLAVDAGKLLTGPARADNVPPFAAGTAAGPAWEDDWDDDLSPDEEEALADLIAAGDPPADGPGKGGAAVAEQTERAPAARKAPARELRDWERALRGLAAEVPTPDKRDAAERAIFYEIDLPASRRERRLVVQVSQRQRRVSGAWGKLKPLRVRPGDLDDIERHADRTVLAYLFGGVDERDAKAGGESGVHRFHLAHELADRLMPTMCGTGNCRVLGSSEKNPQPIEWDGDEPWELTTAVRDAADLPRPLKPAVETEEEEGVDDTAADAEVSERDLDADDAADDAEADDADGEGTSNAKTNGHVSDAVRAGETYRLQIELTRPDAVRRAADAELLLPGGLVLLNGKLARVRDFGAWELAERILDGRGLEIPHGEAGEAIEQIFRLPVLPRLELPDELRLEEVRGEPKRVLLLSSNAGKKGRLPDRATGVVRFDYRGEQVRGGDPRWAIVKRDERLCVLRDREAETVAWGELRDAGFRRLAPRPSAPDVEVAIGDLGAAVRALTTDGWTIRADDKPVREAGELKFAVRSGIDWFELHADVSFGDASVTLPELLAALKRGDDAVRLSDGSLGILPTAWAEQLGLIAGLGSEEEDHLRFSANQAVLLDALLSAQPEVEYDDQFGSLRERLRGLDGVVPVEEPEDFEGELREYQRNGLGWMTFLQDCNLGGCLADDMGLGKTVQLLALLLGRKQAREQAGEKHRPSMVVVPRSLLFNWKNEAERFTPHLSVIEYTGSDRHRMRDQFSEIDLILTTYGTLRRDVMDLKDQPFDYVVLDEAQTIKNASSQVSKASRLLPARHRLALSGTPIENHVGDLWSIFEFLNPGMLGRSSLFRRYAADPDDKQARELLAKGIGPFVLRRTKGQVAAELPAKTEQTLYCDLEPPQRKVYDELREHYRRSLLGNVHKDGLGKNRMHVLEALLRLRQAACHPRLLNPDDKSLESAKVETLIPQLSELIDEGHKALVFSQFTSFLGLVRERLDAEGIRYEYLDGRTRDRKERVERFQASEETGVFLISLKAGGLGLNLTAADYVFLLDPWWNPAVEAQAIDRSHRVGQERPVFAYRMIARDTIEEKIAELQRKKTEIAEAVLSSDENVLSGMTVEDVERLLS